MPAELEWRMWAQLKGAFLISKFIFTPIMPEINGVNVVSQYETMEEALVHSIGTKVFLEPNGDTRLSEWSENKIQDITLILGNTERGNIDLVGDDDYAVKIVTPKPTDFYGINAAAIALAYWVGQ